MEIRNVEEVQEYLKENGFGYELHTPGQSYASGGVLFYWKGTNENRPEYFMPQEKGKAKYGRRYIDIVRLDPVEKGDGAWMFEPLNSTRKFASEKIWQGRVFKRYEGVKIVKLPRDDSDLEYLLE